MTPDDDGMRALRLYDFLNCAATAVSEAKLDHPATAQYAWREARIAAAGAFTPGARPDEAAEAILAVSDPDAGTPGCTDLWNALDAASFAVLALSGGQRELASVVMPDAIAASDALDHDLQMAVLTLLAEAQDIAANEVAS